jgi:hypothetical protein
MEIHESHAHRMKTWSVIKALAPIVLEHVNGCIAEVGMGWSTLVFAQIAIELGVKQYSCDRSRRVRKKMNMLLDNYDLNHENLIIDPRSSWVFAEEFKDTIAVLLLDGKHTLEVVQRELELFMPNIAPSGVVFIHDTCPWRKTYNRKTKLGRELTLPLIKKELKADETIEVFTWPYTAAGCGLTMVMKKDMTQPWYRL